MGSPKHLTLIIKSTSKKDYLAMELIKVLNQENS